MLAVSFVVGDWWMNVTGDLNWAGAFLLSLVLMPVAVLAAWIESLLADPPVEER